MPADARASTSRARRCFLRRSAAVALGWGALAPVAFAGSYLDFFHAIEIDNERTVTELLARGFDPNSRDEQGQAALFVALRGQSMKVARVLWSAPGLEVDARNAAGETPLMMAGLRGQLDAAQALLARGAAPSQPGWSPLHYAATGGNVAIVRLLLARGVPVDARAPNGRTPLMMAARYGSEEAVQALRAAGADPRLRDDAGLDALANALAVGRDFMRAALEAPVPGMGH